jgi:hypothetical protein
MSIGGTRLSRSVTAGRESTPKQTTRSDRQVTRTSRADTIRRIKNRQTMPREPPGPIPRQEEQNQGQGPLPEGPLRPGHWTELQEPQESWQKEPKEKKPSDGPEAAVAGEETGEGSPSSRVAASWSVAKAGAQPEQRCLCQKDACQQSPSARNRADCRGTLDTMHFFSERCAENMTHSGGTWPRDRIACQAWQARPWCVCAWLQQEGHQGRRLADPCKPPAKRSAGGKNGSRESTWDGSGWPMSSGAGEQGARPHVWREQQTGAE